MISIKELAKECGIPPSTINHYTNIGLLNVADRKKNMRLYDEKATKDTLRKIAELRSKGYPLHLIREKLGHSEPAGGKHV